MTVAQYLAISTSTLQDHPLEAAGFISLPPSLYMVGIAKP